MLKQRPVVYLALVAASGGLLLAGVAVDRVLFIAFFGFMLMMHLGGHGHGGPGHRGPGHGGHQEYSTKEEPDRRVHVASAPTEDDVAGK